MEPTIHAQTNSCPYCGDAPVNHFFSYADKLLGSVFDSYSQWVVRHTPHFIKQFAQWLPIGIFKVLVFFKLAHLSSDIDRANSFRSRIIWEEAVRRSIDMKQIIVFGKPIDVYCARINGKDVYFESIPLVDDAHTEHNWDDKAYLKKEFAKHSIPVPGNRRVSVFEKGKLETIFSELKKPLIVKPQVGSRARHTTTNINTLKQLAEAVAVARQLSPYLIIEEHIQGHVCRATIVNGKVAGFYIAYSPYIVGDGVKTVRKLIEDKDDSRPERVERVQVNEELISHISRAGFTLESVVPEGTRIILSHRRGRFFGGTTKEMIDTLHESFIPILEYAASVTGLSVAGFDCIIPDPTQSASSQHWGIIECNTLPFIDLHYYALEGKPRNIAGMIWDMRMNH